MDVSIPQGSINPSYRPRNLVITITRYPTNMSVTLREKLKAIFELHVIRLWGLSAGESVVANTEKLVVYRSHKQAPRILIREIANKAIMKALREWVRQHVADIAEEAILADGLELLIVEPDESLTNALDAWLIRGTFPLTTGRVNNERDVTSLPSSDHVYEIALGGKVETGTDDLIERAQLWLNSFSNTIPEQAAHAVVS